MALKITLKPYEKLVIGGAVITNGPTRCAFTVENKVPILREKNILSESKATTTCRKIYYTIQLMYIDEPNLAAYHKTYWNLVKLLLQAAPGTMPLVDGASDCILRNDFYQALKAARKLIEYEDKAIALHKNRQSERPAL